MSMGVPDAVEGPVPGRAPRPIACGVARGGPARPAGLNGARMVEDPAIIESAAKRCLDAGLALIGLVVSLPVWVLISIAIWLEDGGPIFFVQQRVGRGGREFTAYKFRTIYKRFDREMAGAAATHADDHRVMRVGKLLRRTALNELPQLLNILRGDMSFVGPRPEPPEFLDRYEESVPHMRKLRYQLRPGLTGIAQLFGKHNSHPRNKLRYDLLYMRRRTLGLDLKLIGLSIWNTLCARWDA